MKETEMKAKTKAFALSVIELVDSMPRDRATEHIARQLLRSATSVGANYRAACRGRSNAEMAAKLGIVEEEADESMFWMEVLVSSGRVPESKTAACYSEADEIVRIVVASIKTLKSKGFVREEASGYGLVESKS